MEILSIVMGLSNGFKSRATEKREKSKAAKIFSSGAKQLCIGCNYSLLKENCVSVSLEGNPDITCDAFDLKLIPNSSCSKIIASHVLEHMLGWGIAEERTKTLINILKIWRKKIASGGKLLVAVPDIDLIARVILNKRIPYWKLRKTKYIDIVGPLLGGGGSPYNIHKYIFNFEYLSYCLRKAGYGNIKKVKDLNEFLPKFNNSCKGLLSLNVEAYK